MVWGLLSHLVRDYPHNVEPAAFRVLSERERVCVKGRERERERERERVTCWVCGTTPSALERERSRARQTGEPTYRGTSLTRNSPSP